MYACMLFLMFVSFYWCLRFLGLGTCKIGFLVVRSSFWQRVMPIRGDLRWFLKVFLPLYMYVYACMSCMHTMHAYHACISCMHTMHACIPCMHTMQASRQASKQASAKCAYFFLRHESWAVRPHATLQLCRAACRSIVRWWCHTLWHGLLWRHGRHTCTNNAANAQCQCAPQCAM